LAAKGEQKRENIKVNKQDTKEKRNQNNTNNNNNIKLQKDEQLSKRVKEDENHNNNNSNNNNLRNKDTKKSCIESITSGAVDNRQRVNTDKREEKKIKLVECKQQPTTTKALTTVAQHADNKVDKEILFRKNFHNDKKSPAQVKIEVEPSSNNNSFQSGVDCDRDSLEFDKDRDLTSFCVEEKNSVTESTKMPRPQLLNIVDSRNSAPKQSLQQHHHQPHEDRKRSGKKSDVRMIVTDANEMKSSSNMELNETEKEFLYKVDSVRNYWSKMLDSERDGSDMKRNNLKSMSKAFSTSKSSNDIPQSLRNEDGTFQSFFPTVEIVELNNGETQAALVTARKLNDVEFDHVRYKVMKSEMFQKNIVRSNNHRKETQFDGLMQYLQDYSFQELLANNNVVIIEPVRTKIEKVSDQQNKAPSITCKITNGAGLNRNGSNNLKKHFFYHPIRVNKELYEDELPVPDTVRNVRKLFEESLRMGCVKSKILSERDTNMSKSSDNLKPKKTIRYLTIDTSFDNHIATSKWDSISLSSGVSSAADLNSPCECHENLSGGSRNVSKENLIDNNDDAVIEHLPQQKNKAQTQNVMEKMREYNSSISHYGSGGMASQMLNENEKINHDLMTKVITKDVGGLGRERCNCHGRPSRNVTTSATNNSTMHNKRMNHDYAGEIITVFSSLSHTHTHTKHALMRI
jgi:hypothetical protein